jgi:hypothetical protein
MLYEAAVRQEQNYEGAIGARQVICGSGNAQTPQAAYFTAFTSARLELLALTGDSMRETLRE